MSLAHKFFQRIVDDINKPPRWFVGLIGHTYFILGISMLCFAIDWSHKYMWAQLLVAASVLVGAKSCYTISKVIDAVCASVYQDKWSIRVRYMFTFFLFTSPFWYVNGPTKYDVAIAIMFALGVVEHYFGECSLPKPPKKKKEKSHASVVHRHSLARSNE